MVNAAHPRGAIVKVIIETVLLNDEEKTIACLISKEAGADFVKTSTGFAGGGATVHDVELMRKTVGPQMGVKASGGVRTFEDAESMIKAGATRIGASAGVKIIQGPSNQPSAAKEAVCICKELLDSTESEGFTVSSKLSDSVAALGARYVDSKSDRHDRIHDQG